jgi:membrane protein DedA with SNARE-associated domain
MVLLVVAVVAGLAALLVFEGLHDAAQDARGAMARLEPRFGPAASLAGLYLEESGVPLPVFGDALVVYVGHRLARAPVALVTAWLSLILVTVAGSSNLYLIARFWGRRLVEGPVGVVLDVTPERLARAERWFNRWGAPAIIFGRHILGFRVPITIGAGLFRVPYPVFALSVAVSTAVWAAVWLALGIVFGERIARYLGHNHWAYALLPLGLVFLLAMSARRAWREHRRRRRER